MEWVARLVALALTAAVIENLIFTRGMGWGEIYSQVFTSGRLSTTAIIVFALTTVAAFSGWSGKKIVEEIYPVASHLRPPVYLLIYIVLLLLFLVVWYVIPSLRNQHFPFHPVGAFGFLPLSVMLITGGSTFGLVECLVYGVFAGVGYLGAILLINSIYQFMELRRVPEAMRGTSVVLLYIGLISLALFGLLGHLVAL